MSGRRGQATLVWGETIKLIVTIAFFVIAIYIGAKIAQGYFAMGSSPVKKDWTLIAKEIQSLQPGEVRSVPAGVLQVSRTEKCKGEDKQDCYAGLVVRWFSSGDSRAPSLCRSRACVCGMNALTEKDALTKKVLGCEIVAPACSQKKDSCEGKLCVEKSGIEILNNPELRVVLCRKCTGAFEMHTAPKIGDIRGICT